MLGMGTGVFYQTSNRYQLREDSKRCYFSAKVTKQINNSHSAGYYIGGITMRTDARTLLQITEFSPYLFIVDIANVAVVVILNQITWLF
ncbi:hypothetical protein BCU95_16995 [Vibrio splendidus]|nr:hypothetical protein BCU95_16995 [Vibrio splendidus]